MRLSGLVIVLSARPVYAPGLKLPPAQLNQVRHHALLGHGLAVQAIRTQARPETKVGPAEQVIDVEPVVETAEHIEAARVAMRELNAGYLTVMLEGNYMDAFLANAGADAPKFTDDDLAAIGSPLDFVGTNIYMSHHIVRACEHEPGFELVPYQPTHPSARYPGIDLAIKFTPESMYGGRACPSTSGTSRKSTSPRTAGRSPTSPTPKASSRTSTAVRTTPTGWCGCARISRSCSGRRPRACRCGLLPLERDGQLGSGRPAFAPGSGCTGSTIKRRSGHQS